MRRNIATKDRKKRSSKSPKTVRAAIAAIDWEARIKRNRDGWLKEAFNLKRRPSHVLEGDDWSLVIKLHGYVEAAMNELLITYFNEPKVDEIIRKMDMGHDKRGKLGLIKALGLLPPKAWSFVKTLGDLRSTLSHDIKWLDLNLKTHLRANKDRKEVWRNALNWWIDNRTKKSDDAVFLFPRNAIVTAAVSVMSVAAAQKSGEELRHTFERVKTLEGEYAMLQSEAKRRTKSNPKGSLKRRPPKARNQ